MNSKRHQRLVLLDLDECLGSYGAASAFFYKICKERRRLSNHSHNAFTVSEIKLISKHLIQFCLRPGILSFLKLLYRNKDKLSVILFTNHENKTFLPFLENCLTYLVTGTIKSRRNHYPLFDEWITRHDPRRITTPKKLIKEAIYIYLTSHRQRDIPIDKIRTIMFDDTVSKIIPRKPSSLDTVIEVPPYEWDPPYRFFAHTWELLFGDTNLFPSQEDLEEEDEDFEYLEDELPDTHQVDEYLDQNREFFMLPLMNWLTDDDESESGDTYP